MIALFLTHRAGFKIEERSRKIQGAWRDLRENQTCSKSWLPFCVVFALLSLRELALFPYQNPPLPVGRPATSSGSPERIHCPPLSGTQRAQRSKKFNLARNFQSRSKFSISLENFNLDVSISPTRIGPRWVARTKISFSLEMLNLARYLEFF